MKKFSIWPAGIFVLLGLNVAIVATTVALATSTDSAVVEARPYEKSLQWDAEQRHKAASKDLGWECKVVVSVADESSKSVTVRASFAGTDGAPIVGLNVSALVFHHAHASKRQTIDLSPSIELPGEYVGTIATESGAPLGLWRVVISADKATAVGRRAFEQTTDLMLSFDAQSESPHK
jgi:nitrogen fixation protein FixH